MNTHCSVIFTSCWIHCWFNGGCCRFIICSGFKCPRFFCCLGSFSSSSSNNRFRFLREKKQCIYIVLVDCSKLHVNHILHNRIKGDCKKIYFDQLIDWCLTTSKQYFRHIQDKNMLLTINQYVGWIWGSICQYGRKVNAMELKTSQFNRIGTDNSQYKRSPMDHSLCAATQEFFNVSGGWHSEGKIGCEFIHPAQPQTSQLYFTETHMRCYRRNLKPEKLASFIYPGGFLRGWPPFRELLT